MDSWAKGVKAAGGNKDDMIRIAWDNGEYGQQFKSANTFKGTVNLYLERSDNRNLSHRWRIISRTLKTVL